MMVVLLAHVWFRGWLVGRFYGTSSVRLVLRRVMPFSLFHFWTLKKLRRHVGMEDFKMGTFQVPLLFQLCSRTHQCVSFCGCLDLTTRETRSGCFKPPSTHFTRVLPQSSLIWNRLWDSSICLQDTEVVFVSWLSWATGEIKTKQVKTPWNTTVLGKIPSTFWQLWVPWVTSLSMILVVCKPFTQ